MATRARARGTRWARVPARPARRLGLPCRPCCAAPWPWAPGAQPSACRGSARPPQAGPSTAEPAAQGGAPALSLAQFPSLDDAAVAAQAGKEREAVLVQDGMLEALRQLKISEWLRGGARGRGGGRGAHAFGCCARGKAGVLMGVGTGSRRLPPCRGRAGINESRFTQHLLLECLDMRYILERGENVEEVGGASGLLVRSGKRRAHLGAVRAGCCCCVAASA